MFMGLAFDKTLFQEKQQVELKPAVEKFVDFIATIWKNEKEELGSTEGREGVDMVVSHSTMNELAYKTDLPYQSCIIAISEILSVRA